MLNYEALAKEAMEFVRSAGTLADGGIGTLPASAAPRDVAEFVAEGELDGDDLVRGVPYEEFVDSLETTLKGWE